jgi:hypothetical protein
VTTLILPFRKFTNAPKKVFMKSKICPRYNSRPNFSGTSKSAITCRVKCNNYTADSMCCIYWLLNLYCKYSVIMYQIESIKFKVKVNLFLWRYEGQWGNGGIYHPFLTSTLDGGSASFSGRSTHKGRHLLNTEYEDGLCVHDFQLTVDTKIIVLHSTV